MRTTTLLSELIDILSKDSTTAAFHPTTDPIRACELNKARFDAFLSSVTSGAGNSQIWVQAGIQWGNSPDTSSWDSPVAIALGTAPQDYAKTAGWTRGDAFNDLFSYGTPRLFARLGLFGISAAGSNSESGQSRLRAELLLRPGRVLVLPPQLVFANNTSTTIDIDLSGPIPAGEVTALFGTFQVETTSDNIEAKLIWQQTNTPDVDSDTGSNWSTPASPDLSSYRSTTGTEYGGWTTVTPAYDFIRLVARCRLTSGTVGSPVKFMRIRPRLDIRSC